MKKWIRWSGLVGFVSVVTLVAVFWLFALGPLIKMAVEKYGSDAVGAQVNVADISLGFSPLSLTITGVQVADKDAPMENIVSFDTAVATLEPFPLLLGKAIIPDVKLTGVTMCSVRNYSGALVAEKSKPKSDNNESDSSESESDSKKSDEQQVESKALPSADEILEREKLLTMIYGEAFEGAYQQRKKEIDDALANLPSEKALKNYETDLNRILKGKFKDVDDFKQRKKELDALKAQFKKDKQSIADAKRAISEGKSDLKQKWSQLKGAPKQDLANLKGKYTIDGAGASNLAALLFGDDAGGYAETALGYYEKVRPLMIDDEAKADTKALKDKRLDGRFIHFETDRPLPDFWIKTLSFTMALPAMAKGSDSMGQVAVKVKDITHQQDVIDAPTRLWATGQNLKRIKSLKLTGLLELRTSPGKDSFDLNVEGWNLSNMKLGLAGLKLVSSNLQVQANAVFSDGEMNTVGNGLFKQSKFDSKDRTTLAKEMVAALKNVDQFKVTAVAKGELTDPDVNLKSDLDSQLNKAFDKRIDQKQAELENQLKKKLNDKLLSYGGDYTEQLKDLNLIEGSLGSKSDSLEKLGKTKLSSYEDQLKAESKAKADAKKAKAKEKSDAKKAKAKADAEKKKKELERKAKEKLKKLF
jgi:uncharacterized protein (TIGR03545 family)